MTTPNPTGLTPLRRRSRLGGLLALGALVAGLLTGCATQPTSRLTPTPSGVVIQSGIQYWTNGTEKLLLDACTPAKGTKPRPIVVILHGGGFEGGSRNDPGERALCAALAKSGLAAFSVDYRLAPKNTYPVQLRDVSNAIRWLRSAPQVQRFNLVAGRVALIGSSAGAIIAQELGTQGKGPRTRDTRVRAVISLSGVSLFTAQAEKLGNPTSAGKQLILGYLGCRGLAPSECPKAKPASAALAVDPTDPPMLLVNGSDELVPVQQAQYMQKTLQANKVPVQLVVVPGNHHGIALLNGDIRKDIRSFLKKYL